MEMKKGVLFALFLALRPFLSSFLLDASLAYPPRAGMCTKESKTVPLLFQSLQVLGDASCMTANYVGLPSPTYQEDGQPL
jgi:hypothetical protein